MSSIQLDLTPLDNAIARLDEGWTRYQRDVSDIQIRDGLIQRFEFTYEVSPEQLRNPPIILPLNGLLSNVLKSERPGWRCAPPPTTSFLPDPAALAVHRPESIAK